MNKQELIDKIIYLPSDCSGPRPMIDKLTTLELIKLLDEPETGHADEAPRYVKNILARLRELPVHDRKVWLKAIMGEFEQDFSHAKWREGYEQGKFEGEWVSNQLKDADKIRQELNKPVIPQFVADWIENCKRGLSLRQAISQVHVSIEVDDWLMEVDADGNFVNQETFARAWLDGYKIEKEKKYKIALLNRNDGTLYLVNRNAGVADKYGHFSPVVLFFTKETKFSEQCYELTKQDVVSNGFGWVFDCPGIQIEEVE